ncbi:MAG: hypothetical protein V4622_12950 [Bacteroidota bacterium]
MSVFKDFQELKVNFRSALLALIIEASFIYVSIFFIVPEFIQNTIFHIPILFSLCVGLIVTSIWNACMSAALEGEVDNSEHEAEMLWVLSVIIGIVQTCIVGFICYFSELKLLLYTVTLVFSALTIGIIIVRVRREKPTDKNP